MQQEGCAASATNTKTTHTPASDAPQSPTTNTAADTLWMRRAVERAGDRNWMAVAREVNMALGHAPGGGRTAKQCRGRYMHHLKPGLKRGPWAWDEEDALVAAHKRYGNSWSKVARHLPGRTETDIKNHCERAAPPRRPSSAPLLAPLALPRVVPRLLFSLHRLTALLSLPLS